MAVILGPAFGLSAWGPVWLLQGGPAALILAGLALGPPWPATPLVLLFSRLGDASYSLYLSHPFAIRPLRDIWLRFGGAQASVIAYLVAACLFATACAFILFVAVERPMTRSLRRRLDSRRYAGAPPPSASIRRDATGVRRRHGDGRAAGEYLALTPRPPYIRCTSRSRASALRR